VDKREGLFEENYEHSTRNSVLIELIVVHVGLLREYKRGVLKAYMNCMLEPIIGSV